MALTEYQRSVCRLLAASRVERGESYVAGGSALNELLRAARLSRDIDIFHDSDEAVARSWDADRRTLEAAGHSLRVVRERPAFVEAEVGQGGERVVVEWTRDSAFRFFPLQANPDLGLTMHPFDLATNKLLALVSRREVRDWVDALAIHRHLQPLGYVTWAACAKDPGFSPASILELAARAHYSHEEVSRLAFTGVAPDAAQLSRTYRQAIAESHEITAQLPLAEVGACVLSSSVELFCGDPAALESALDGGRLLYHHARLHGAFPQLKS